MANIDMTNGYGSGMTVTDKRWTPTDVASPATSAEFVATQDLRTLDLWLNTQNAAYWTQTRLNQESMWDKLFYLRSQVGAPGGLA
jgi:hypothetical protein